MPLQGAVNISSASTLTLDASFSIYVYNGAGTATWTLPAITGNSGEILVLYNRGTGTVTVSRSGTDQIDDYGGLLSSIPLPPNTSLELLNDGTFWLVMNSSAPLPHCDSVTRGADRTGTGVASGTAYTWTHTVASGNPYGLVAIVSSDATVDPTTITSATVTFGGVTLSSIGSVMTTSGGFSYGWLWLFGGPGIPSGAQTVSVTLTQSGQTFHHYGVSYTYQNVAGPGGFFSATGGNGNNEWMSLTVPRTSGNPAKIWYGIEAPTNTALGVATGTELNYYNNGAGSVSLGYTADMAAFGTDTITPIMTISGTSTTPIWGMCALELFGQKPSGPYLNTVGSALNAGGTFGTNTFTHVAAPGSYVFVAIEYLKASGTSLGAVRYGGTTMTQLATSYCNNDTTGNSGQLFLYGLANVSGGSKTVALTYTGGTPQGVWAQSVSFYAVNTVGTPATVHGTGTSMSQSVSCTPGQVILQCFGTDNQTIVETDGSTSLFNGPTGLLPGSLQISQAPATNTFTATQTSGPWAGLAVVLS